MNSNITALNGLRILVTRPLPAGKELCFALDSAGGKSIYFPTIEFAPSENVELFQQQISQLDCYDSLVFISPQSVYASSQSIHKQWPVFPSRVKIAAVGPGTAKALQEAKLPVQIYPQHEWSSQGLLDMPAFKMISEAKIAIMSGADGREFLAEELSARKATVTNIIAYQRCVPRHNVGLYLELIESKNIDAIVCTSGEGLRNLKHLLHAAAQHLQEIVLVVISERMLVLAQEFGWKTILLAKNPSHSAIIEILKNSNLKKR